MKRRRKRGRALFLLITFEKKKEKKI